MLVNLDLLKDFIMYVFNRKSNIATVLNQKDDKGKGEHPITFHSRNLKDYVMNYNFIESQAFTIVKGLKKL